MYIGTYQCHFPNNELSVIEGSNLLIALAVDNGHGLETHGLHIGLGGQQEPVVEVIEKLSTGERGRERDREGEREVT